MLMFRHVIISLNLSLSAAHGLEKLAGLNRHSRHNRPAINSTLITVMMFSFIVILQAAVCGATHLSSMRSCYFVHLISMRAGEITAM